jgi:hypothetical protein
LLDWLEMTPGTPMRTVATTHLLLVLTATGLFLATWFAQLDG